MEVLKHFRNSIPSCSVPGTILEQVNYRAIVLLLICTLSVSYTVNCLHDVDFGQLFNLSMPQ